jgi:YVTN family beta-propeller protein
MFTTSAAASQPRRRTFLAAGGAVLASALFHNSCRAKGLPFAGYALVVVENSPRVSVVDLAAFALTDRLEFPDPIASLLQDPRSNTLIALAPDAGCIHFMDWPARRLQRTVALGSEATQMRLDPNQPALWVSLSSPPALVRLPLDATQPDLRIPLPAAPLSFDVAPYLGHLAASLNGGGLAIVPDPASAVVRRMRKDEHFGPLLFRSDGRQVIAANHSALTLSLVRASDAVPVVDLPVAMPARNLCFKPDGGLLFVTDGERDAVSIVYPYTTEVDRTVLAGRSPGAMYACASPSYLLVANRLSSDITILDLVTGKLVAIVPVGQEPGFVTATPDGQYALALNEGSGDMAVIRMANVRSRRNKTAPLFTMVPVGERPRSLIVVADA